MLTIGQALKKLRETQGVSGSAIAKAAGLSEEGYFKIENEQRDASFVVMFKICQFYEISLNEIADIVDFGKLENPE